MTEADWKRQLAAAHPDRGGDPAAFLALTAARAQWRTEHGTCVWCRKPFLPRRRGQRHCNLRCLAAANAVRRRKRYQLPTGAAHV